MFLCLKSRRVIKILSCIMIQFFMNTGFLLASDIHLSCYSANEMLAPSLLINKISFQNVITKESFGIDVLNDIERINSSSSDESLKVLTELNLLQKKGGRYYPSAQFLKNGKMLGKRLLTVTIGGKSFMVSLDRAHIIKAIITNERKVQIDFPALKAAKISNRVDFLRKMLEPMVFLFPQ